MPPVLRSSDSSDESCSSSAKLWQSSKKVVTPTRKQLLNYTLVVLGFILFMMLLVTGLDLVFGKLVGWVFGGAPLWPLW